MFKQILAKYPKYFDLNDILGSSKQQVTELEAAYNVNLPSDYKMFLLEMGQNAGGLLALDNSEFLITDLPQLQPALELLFDENAFKTSEKYFCIFMHEGYTADLFLPNQNPLAVYQFNDGLQSIKLTHNSFMAYFLEKVAFHIKLIDSLNNY